MKAVEALHVTATVESLWGQALMCLSSRSTKDAEDWCVSALGFVALFALLLPASREQHFPGKPVRDPR